MNVSAWSIRNPIAASMLFFLLSIVGLFSFSNMKIQNFPDIDLPTIIVSASLPGASPDQLQNDVARKLENSVASLQGLKHISTSIQEGSVTLTIEFRLEKSVQEALDDVRSAIQTVRADLPSEVRDPVVKKLELSGLPVLVYAVHSDRLDKEALSWFVEDKIARRLLSVRGVGAVNPVGGVKREVRVSIDPVKLTALGVSIVDVSRALANIQQDVPGGRSDIGTGEQSIRTLGSQYSAAEIAQLNIPLSSGQSIRLDQIATVEDTIAEVRSSASLNGKPVVGFEVSRSRGESEVTVAQGVRAQLKALQKEYPDIRITEAFDFVTPVEQDYESSMKLLYEGAFLAVVVVWLFLREWRATLISAVALPMSVLPAFIGMYLMGFSINVVSLLALSLVIGVLVDDAIVEVENIVRHLRMGKTPYQAAMEAADEIGLAVIATTFTLIAVFLPTAFMSGIAGKFFKEFGWTASLAVFASLVVARMLTPMMAAYMLKPLMNQEHEPKWLNKYMSMAAWSVANKWKTMVFAGLFFVGSVALIPLLPTGFIPPDDNSQTQISLELAPGSTLEQTQAIVEQARSALETIPEVRSVYATIGGGSAGGDLSSAMGVGEARKATLTIQLAERGERPRKQIIETELRKRMADLPGVRTKVGLGGSGEKYIMVLSGDDPVALNQAALALLSDIRTVPGIGNVSSSASLVSPEIAIRPNFALASELGINSQALGDTLRVATMGDYDFALPKLNLPERQIPINLRLQDSARKDIEVLKQLTIPGIQGPVSLGTVADFELAGGSAVISRYDRVRNINIEVELAGLAFGDAKNIIAALPAMQNLPTGVTQSEVGDAEAQTELFQGFGLAMLTGILCIYIVLVLLFKHFLHPVTILAALPLSLGGAFVGLLVANSSFSMPSLIGLIMLMGIATKNSILLVEYAIEARRGRVAQDGQEAVAPMSRYDALMDACHKRARPIIMTTIAMGAGMLPIAIGWGAADPSFRSPMAIAVIGGLITSTVLSLLVIPAVFIVLDDIGLWFYRRIIKRPQNLT